MLGHSNYKLNTFRWVCSAISPLIDAKQLRLHAPRTETSWNYAVNVASTNLVMPGLYLALRDKSLLDLVSTDLLSALEGVYSLNILHNTRLRLQMQDISRMLNQAGISPIWLKGSTSLLAPDWQQSGRMMLDLDFWIPDVDAQHAAIARLEEAGYFIPDVYRGIDFSSSQHFAPMVKDGEPARIEIHRNIVRREVSELLSDDDALHNVSWLNWEGTNVGQLASQERLMHSYIQCTEMSAMSRGKIPLMKILDFLQRLPRSGDGSLPSDFFEKINRTPWQLNARRLFSFLKRDFGMQSPFAHDDSYLRILSRKINYPGSLYFAEQFYHDFSIRRIGSPRLWLPKLTRYWKSIRQS